MGQKSSFLLQNVIVNVIDCYNGRNMLLNVVDEWANNGKIFQNVPKGNVVVDIYENTFSTRFLQVSLNEEIKKN